MSLNRSEDVLDVKITVDRLLNHLNDKDFVVLNMYYLQGYTFKEIGNMIYMDESEVSRIENRAIKKLSKFIGLLR